MTELVERGAEAETKSESCGGRDATELTEGNAETETRAESDGGWDATELTEGNADELADLQNMSELCAGWVCVPTSSS